MSNPTIVNASIGSSRYAVSLTTGAHQWLADEPAANGGGDAGPTPTQLLLSSLGACTSITLQMYAGHKGWPLERVDVELVFNPDGHATGTESQIERRISLHGDLSAEQCQRLLQVANACPIHKVLTGTIKVSTALTGASA